MSGNNSDFNIAPRPQWSFGEVVQHAWQVYVGRGIESVGRRNVLFRTWAAMVGADRAVAELSHFCTVHGGEKAAATEVGCAVSTLRRLRRQFQLVDAEPLVPLPLALAQGEELRGVEHHYVVEDRLGSGGMGVVYRVSRLRNPGVFAAKVLSTSRFAITNTVRDRFLRESRLAQSFDSPRVVRSIEPLHHRGTLVSIMELLSGRTLHDLLQPDRSQTPPTVRLRWLLEIAEGLSYLHDRGIVHRDLSPRNCMVRSDETLALGDFGVARRMDDSTVTTGVERMGSLIYISPQQRENPHAAQFSDDVFALGQLAYHILTGRSPHGGIEQVQELGYPAELDAWVRELRSPDPAVRPRAASRCLETLAQIDLGPTSLSTCLPALVT